MDVIVCLDERNGMCFNHRRQSQDRVVIADILQRCKGQPLWMNAYSAALFPEAAIQVAEDFLQQAPAHACCFVEDQPVAKLEAAIDCLVVYRWHRHYPADRHFDVDISKWRLVKQEELVGYSHDVITREEYHR